MKSYRHKPFRMKRKKSILKNRYFWLSILALSAALGILYLILLAPFFQIKKINISGNKIISAETLQNIIDKNINQKILFLNSKSIFLANIGAIKKEISQNPLVDALKVGRKIPNKINLEVRERQVAGTYCAKDQCFSFDKNGIAFKEDDQADNSPLIIDAQKTREIHPPEKVLDANLLESINNIDVKLKSYQLNPTKYNLIGQQKMHTQISEKWEIYFDLDGDLNQQIYNLKTILEKEIPPGKRGNLEYIDLRFDNRVYYK